MWIVLIKDIKMCHYKVIKNKGQEGKLRETLDKYGFHMDYSIFRLEME